MSVNLDSVPCRDRRLAMPAGTAGRVSSLRAKYAMLKSSKRITPKRFKLHDHVSWNSEAGRVTGRIIKVHTKNVDYKGYVHDASKDAPQYEIKSDKTDHVALHKGSALRLVR
jgi:Hypervirulence associated proteins TUDOR domain